MIRVFCSLQAIADSQTADRRPALAGEVPGSGGQAKRDASYVRAGTKDKPENVCSRDRGDRLCRSWKSTATLFPCVDATRRLHPACHELVYSRPSHGAWEGIA
jgi:hypothetical protein